MVTFVLDIIWHSCTTCGRQCISGNSHFVNSLSAIFSAHQDDALSRQNEINILLLSPPLSEKNKQWDEYSPKAMCNAAAVIEIYSKHFYKSYKKSLSAHEIRLMN